MRDMPTLAYDIPSVQRAKLACGLELREIAERAGCSLDTVGRFIKTGRVRPRSARRIARAMNVELADLVPPPLIHGNGPLTTSPAGALSEDTSRRAYVQHTTNGNGRRVASASKPDTSACPESDRGGGAA